MGNVADHGLDLWSDRQQRELHQPELCTRHGHVRDRGPRGAQYNRLGVEHGVGLGRQRLECHLVSGDDTTIGTDHTQGSAGGSINLAPGSTSISGASVGGNITVPAGSSLILTNSTVGGNITATNPGSITICGSTVGNTVKISGASGFVLLRDAGDDGCAPNTFRTSVTLTSNHGAVDLVGNHIGSNTSVTGTTGTGPFLPDDQGAELEGNTIGGTLSCSGNTPIANDGNPNSVAGARSGQCPGSF